ncbi:hypothetical protein OVA06_07325 [Pseudarthrobacter sp. SL88]|uniref:DUF6993 domain-containing protein n=1 Tax=Pseudarthrobacter sp. SL88 TaxID=2994666 RepID=UPI0022758EB6|nr:hypothetical protein [Pseudarthrobacter sp. SL88]MCY1674521.1 hypothetical protein [Pseudarthrobacter sp. SL88]
MRHSVTSRLTATTGAALVLLLSGCVSGPSPAGPGVDNPAMDQQAQSQPAPEQQSGSTTPSASPEAAATPSGQALAATSDADKAATEVMKRTVTQTLTGLAGGTPKPATAQVTEVLTAAGIAPAALQVSQSRTPTGLEADAIEAAVLQGKDCVIGQVREGSVTVTVLPVLASGKCFVGS